MQTSIRVSGETRQRLGQIAAEECNGASLDEVISRLLDEHWERMVVAEVEAYRQAHPEEWSEYIADADAVDRATAPSLADDPWEGPRPREDEVAVPGPRKGRVRR